MKRPPRQYKTFTNETISEYIAKGRNAHRLETQSVKAAKICKAVGYDDTYRMTEVVISFAPEVYYLLRDGDKPISIDKRDFVWLCNRMDRAMKRLRRAGRKWNSKRACTIADANNPVINDRYVDIISKAHGYRFDELLTNPVTGNTFMLGHHSTLEQEHV